MTNKADAVVLSIKLPPDVRAWLAQMAKRNVSSQRAEIVRSVRERMEREGAKVA